jgi:hypothetical protein
MTKNRLLILLAAILAILIIGCASSGTQKGYSIPSDADLYNEGMWHLGGKEAITDLTTARMKFDTLVKTYPKSKFKPFSETLIRMIDELQTGSEKIVTNRQLLEKIQTEKVRLSKENEKYRTENATLHQENEQLKKDIEQLKNLELQLEKRRGRSKK